MMNEKQPVKTNSPDIRATQGTQIRRNSGSEVLNKLLEVSNQELAAFSFAIGHDFRNTLNHILSFVKLLAQHSKESLDEKSLHYLEIIQDRGEHLDQMIQSIKNYGNISQTKLNVVQIQTQAMINEIIENIKNRNKNRTVDWKISPLPPIEGDPVLMKEAFTLLLDNARKFSELRNPAEVKISANDANTHLKSDIVISIQDNGQGFDAGHCDRLFWPFQRFHNETEFPGIGMGLATVRRIIQMHHGNVKIVSSPENGTTVSITLPYGEH